VQASPLPIGGDLEAFRRDVARVVAEHAPDLIVYPELHLFGADDPDLEVQNGRLRAGAVDLDEYAPRLGAIAREHGVWLLPGSVVERSEAEPGSHHDPYNTAPLFSPAGELRAQYRKVFPWRPTELYAPGDHFVVADLDGLARVGISICFDAWWPEVTRHLAWLGAEVVLNVVKTTTPDRAQEVVLAQANAIVNQNFTVSVNTAGPIGRGRSIVTDPEGVPLASADEAPTTLVVDLDLDAVARVRRDGTAGSVVPWQQFQPGDARIPLPLYDGDLDPARWHPGQPLQ
jgi:predicted amidohydrolase